MQDNPYMQIPNPWEEYQKNYEKMVKSNPQLFELDRLAYELFLKNSDGIKFLELNYDLYVDQDVLNFSGMNVKEQLLYWEGFRACIRGFKRRALEHKKRIESK